VWLKLLVSILPVAVEMNTIGELSEFGVDAVTTWSPVYIKSKQVKINKCSPIYHKKWTSVANCSVADAIPSLFVIPVDLSVPFPVKMKEINNLTNKIRDIKKENYL
jgi:hypothetical protein